MASIARGSQLGPYEILELIGGGGMGEIYRARDTRLGRDVAIKILGASYSQDPDRIQRFVQEARATSALNHPGLITIHDFGEHDRRSYLVLELLEGEDLRQKLRKGALNPRRVIEYGRQICEALAVAHEKGIVHRDLKPGNVFIGPRDRVKILDFGIAKLRGNSPTMPGEIIGSLGYMAPEQICAREVDHRTDIFAVGLLLYEMIIGRPAFAHVTDFSKIGAILNDDPPDLDQLPDGLRQIVLRCIEKEPRNRFQSTRDLGHALEAMGAGSGTFRGLSHTLRRHLGPWRRVIPWVGAALVIALVAGSAAWWVARDAGKSTPSYQRVSFRRGYVTSARFAPDGRSIVYSAAWEGGSHRLWTTNPDEPESIGLDLAGDVILGLSRDGQAAVLQSADLHLLGSHQGTMAIGTLSGAAPRPVAENVTVADFAPDGRLAIVRALADGARSIEFPPGARIRRVDAAVRDLRFSPDGSMIACLRRRTRIGKEYDVDFMDPKGSVVRTIEGFVQARGLAWHGEDVLVISETSHGTTLERVTTDGSRSEITRLDGTLRLLDVSATGMVLMCRDDYREGIAIGRFGEEGQKDYSWLDGSGPSDFSADGAKILFSEFNKGGGDQYATYLRPLDGSAAVRLGSGYATSLSPDGRWALSVNPGPPSTLTMLSTGTENTRTLERGDIIDYGLAQWFPDGRRILISARNDKGNHVFIQETAGGPPAPLDAALHFPFTNRPMSPDGRTLALADESGATVLYDVARSAVTRPDWSEPGWTVVGWSQDGASLFMHSSIAYPSELYRTNIATGERTLAAKLVPPDTAGVFNLLDVIVSRDGSRFAYGYLQNLSQLVLMRAAK